MSVYYNENDPFAAQWLRNLISAGHLPEGHVDERDIEKVRWYDVAAFTQCHFFAGIGGWPLALTLAGWPADRAVWTGSCPCQPFSAAGKRRGVEDERHLWPVWRKLIHECKPERILGEQVEAAIRGGWLDLVFSDLEAEGYACGAAVLPACSVGAPHLRQRLWFVADAGGARARWDSRNGARPQTQGDSRGFKDGNDARDAALARGTVGGLAHPSEPGRHELPLGTARTHGRPAAQSGRLRDAGGMDDAAPQLRDGSEGTRRWRGLSSDDGFMGDAVSQRLEERPGERRNDGPQRQTLERAGRPWADLEWLPCTDGKARPTKPGLFPLAHGVSYRMGSGSPFEGKSRVGMLRCAGNAIVPQVAAEFIQAFTECAP